MANPPAAAENAVNVVNKRVIGYLADDVFFTGTAAEVSPIRSIDGITIGAGKRGPITTAIQNAFFGLFNGATEDRWGWLDYV